MSSALGDRMKDFEARYAGQRLLPQIPLCARMDGKAFHTFTRGLGRPYDTRLTALMVETTRHLVGETGARVGYTQSDEISLVWHEDDPETMLPFGGKLLKMTSILAAMTTAYFARRLPDHIPEKVGKPALFDARVWSVPTTGEAANYLYWRERDATRNSILMAAHSVYSPSEMHRKDTATLMDMLMDKGINWNDYPRQFKRGTYVQKRHVERPFSVEELEKLPPKHDARKNPNLVLKRCEYVELEMPPLSKVVNKEDVLFRGAEPRRKEHARAEKS